ncbi:MAG: PucR family transcriptional regulator [Trebonia sp.]
MDSPQELDGRPTARDEALLRLIDRVEANFDPIVAAAIAALFRQVEPYHSADGTVLERAATENARVTFRVLLTSLREGRPLSEDDLVPTQRHAARLGRQRIPLQAFLQGLRVGQMAIWDGVLDAAGDDRECQHAALTIVEPLLRLFEIVSAGGARAYLEAQAQQLAEIDRLRRDLLEDLLSSADVSAGPQQALLRAAGLLPGRPYVVAIARPVVPVAASEALTDVAATLGRGDMHAPGLAIARRDEIVAVLPVPAAGQQAVISRLELALDELSHRGTGLGAGISLSHDGLAQCPAAYAEASRAHTGLRGRPGVLALPALTVSDYLVLCADETARRLIRPKIREFVTDDDATTAELVDTVLEYVANDLNATASAKRMHVHVNTFYYRLDSIAKRTGSDLHRLTDLQELLIAIRLLRTG